MNKQERNKLKQVNNFLREVEEWRKDDTYRVQLVKWLIVKGYSECESVQDLTDLLDNCVVCPSNTEILTAENVAEFQTSTIKEMTSHTRQYVERLSNKKGYFLHYPSVKNGNCQILAPRTALYFNLNDINDKPKAKKIRFVVFGALWFDSVNGNTYNSAKIIDTQTRNIYFTRFTYGYGSAYISEATEYIKQNIKKNVDIFEVFNGGYMHTTKKVVKDHLY